MKAFLFISTFIVTQTLLSAEPPEQTGVSASRPLTLLFAGSSSTYWNDFPREAARVVDKRFIGHAGETVIPEIVGRSGSDIRVYLDPGFNRYEYGVKPGQSFLDKIRDEKSPFVVLQTVCRFIMGDDDPSGTGNAHAEAVTKYCDAIRAAGGEPIFYEMGWGNSDREAEGRQRILDLAVKNKIRLFAPCSTAWARVYRERPELALQHPKDNAHPGDTGLFLNLACFYAALTGESPVGKLPRTYPVWPHALPKAATEAEKADEAARIAAFKPDAYQSKMPKWMFRNMSMKLTATVDEATAKYLETIAWETTQHVKQTLLSAPSKAKKSALHDSTRQKESPIEQKRVSVSPSQTGVSVSRFLDTHCLECHDSDAKKGDLDLSPFTDESTVMKNRSIWGSVYEKVESHQMPPPKQKSQPTEAQRHELMAWIMDIAARPDPALGTIDPGKPVLRRLTRLEYNNAIRDLFALPMDVFMFPERLPITDKSYFNPSSGQMSAELKVVMREYGSKYPVLCPQLGLPGDNRAEHGYRNRGDAMDFSPLMLEKYLAAAQEIVNAPELPARSRVFADLIGVKQTLLSVDPKKQSTIPVVPLAGKFAPDTESLHEAKDSSITLADFRKQLASAFAEGRGGVFDMPKPLSNKVIAGKGGLLKGSFGERSITINPNADLWIASFSTVKAASAPVILTNKEKGKTSYELTFDIVSTDPDEAVERLGLCVMGRKSQTGSVKLTAVLTDATEKAMTLDIAEAESGTTFCSFSAHAGEGIKRLVVDGSQLKGDYLVLDDIAIITSGVKQTLLSVQEKPKAPAMDEQTRASVSPQQTGVSASQRIAAFAERAFRRAVSHEELSSLTALYDAARKANASEADAMRQALTAVLASPSFLYVEANGTPGTAKVSPLEDAELATRLALFLWSSTPDDELLSLAKAGRLHDASTLEAQTRRMLKDARCRELSESFAVQWLRLDQLYTAKPDRDLFKSFYSGPQGKSTLHGATLTEALLLFETVMVEDRSIMDFLAADYTWLNPQLARLYGLKLGADEGEAAVATNSNRELKTKNDKSGNWQRVKLTDARRGGFMSMAAPMIVTSLPFRTSPVKRGAWLLETLFNRPPTEPKVAFAIENDTKEAAQQMSIRQKFEAHRNKAACYSCHIRLDPPGFALERFNPVGQWREMDASVPVDAKGEWNGQPFDGPAEFKANLTRQPHEFSRGFIEHLLSYALARPLAVYDMPVVDQIERAAKADGWKLSRVITEIVKSYPFTHTRS